MKTTAKLFKNGRFQAVRLPKEFRFAGDAVKIQKDGGKYLITGETLDAKINRN